jgi:hypothetical protein
MNDLVLIVSHLGSGSDEFCSQLNANYKFKKVNKHIIWNNNEHFFNLKQLYFWDHINLYDHIVYDENYSWHDGYDLAKFIFILNTPTTSFSSSSFINEYNWARYYCYRLRRMKQMANKVKNGFFILGNSFNNNDKLNEFLDTKNLVYNNFSNSSKRITNENKEWVDSCFEKNLLFFKNRFGQ